MVLSPSFQPGSSGSESDKKNSADTGDEKIMKRMISNRESARRSRMKKQKHLEDLTKEIGALKRQNTDIVNACDAKEKRQVVIQSQNEDLIREKKALMAYLSSMNAENFQGNDLGAVIQEPWQVHGQRQQICAKTSSMFRI